MYIRFYPCQQYKIAMNTMTPRFWTAAEYFFLAFFIGLFFYSGIEKMTNALAFSVSLSSGGLFTERSIAYLMYLVPAIEFVAGLLLLFYRRIGLLFSFILFCLFTVYLVLLKFFYEYSSCGCGGLFSKMSFEWHLVVNIACCLVLLALLMLHNRRKGLSLAPGQAHFMDWVALRLKNGRASL